ncbi:MAG TPA: DUF3618 domain-containing protein, partial [Casimicrobiaceae bacterium]|nr:DUF3618 domain-containing protein [Casimicrobiaceae bacterium]
MKSSEQLEREADDRRAQINDTLDELRARMTPGQIVDQVIDYARSSGGGRFASNLGRQIVERPLPIVLVGTGLAWLMLSNGRRARRPNGGVAAAELRDTTGRAASGAREAADSASATASGLVERAKSVVSSMRSTISDTGGTARDAVSRSG